MKHNLSKDNAFRPFTMTLTFETRQDVVDFCMLVKPSAISLDYRTNQPGGYAVRNQAQARLGAVYLHNMVRELRNQAGRSGAAPSEGGEMND